jgi:hypothetical protein
VNSTVKSDSLEVQAEFGKAMFLNLCSIFLKKDSSSQSLSQFTFLLLIFFPLLILCYNNNIMLFKI